MSKSPELSAGVVDSDAEQRAAMLDLAVEGQDDWTVLHRFAPSPRRARMSGGRFGLSVLSSTRMRPSSIATT